MEQNKPREVDIPNKQKHRLIDARESLRIIQEQLEPFTTKRRVARPTTKGDWCDSTCLELPNLARD